MIERYEWRPSKPDKEPHAKLTVCDKLEVEATRQNSASWHFLGNIAVFNCLQMDHVDEQDSTLVMFSFAPHYKELYEYMRHNAYPVHANQPVVPESIADAYFRTVTHDVGEPPLEWFDA
jgi:hypothetical protein